MASVTTPVQHQICDGPAEYKFKIGYWERRTMEFTLRKDHTKVTLMLNGVEFEDASCERFIIQGYVHGKPLPNQFRGYYDLKRRTGWIEF